MELIEWSDEMSVNIKVIDDQHRTLVDLLNKLFEAMLDGKTKEIINEIIKELLKYSEYHFDTEEELFTKHNYPGYQSHKIQHSYFIDEINNFKYDLINKKTTVTVDVFNFLKDWLTEHILHSDKNYSKFLNNKGVY